MTLDELYAEYAHWNQLLDLMNMEFELEPEQLGAARLRKQSVEEYLAQLEEAIVEAGGTV